ncbi:MAG: hypothetical protein JWQ98_839 [Chlorobi bacterium]|nr:hypothetical protein [Chlorobiota bacterium]
MYAVTPARIKSISGERGDIEIGVIIPRLNPLNIVPASE